MGVGYLVALLLMNAPWQVMVAGMALFIGVGIGYAAMPTLIMSAARRQMLPEPTMRSMPNRQVNRRPETDCAAY